MFGGGKGCAYERFGVDATLCAQALLLLMKIGDGAIDSLSMRSVGNINAFFCDFCQHTPSVGGIDICPGCKKILAFGKLGYAFDGFAGPVLCLVERMGVKCRSHRASCRAVFAIRFVQVQLDRNIVCQKRRPKLRRNGG